jgi:RNA polymerase sigma factor (sigma-70 family)
VLESLERVFRRGSVAALSEGQLLERYVRGGDEAAFAALVARHGPMVLGVCRRVLRDRHDVEDAFQATFLVLVRRAGAIRDGGRVGHWLYGVAHRVAVRARANAARRYAHERTAPGAAEAVALAEAEAGLGSAPEGRELRGVIDEELARLPEVLRAPVVLCYLDGLTHEEAAGRLGWPVGTVRSRMARARDRLRQRLARRGLSADGAAMAVALARVPVPDALLDATVGASLTFATNDAAAALASTSVSATAAALARGTLHAMTLSKLTTLGAAAVACALTLGGVQTFAVLYSGAGAGPGVAQKPADDGDEPKPADRREALSRSVERLQAELAESARRNAELQKEIEELRAELESLRPAAPPAEPKGREARGTPKGAMAGAAPKGAVAGAAPKGAAAAGMMGMAGYGMPGMGRTGGMGMGGGMAAGGMPGGYGAMMGGGGGMMPGMGMMGGMGGGGAMMAGMGGVGGGGRPGFPGAGTPGLRYISTGQLIVVPSPEGDKVVAYSTETGKARSLDLSQPGGPARQAVPVVSPGLVAMAVSGPKVTRIATFSVSDGKWHPQDLREPVEQAMPIVGNHIAAYALGRRVYAFSATVNRWDVLEVPARDADLTPVVGQQTVTVEHGSHLYVFSSKTGKWSDIDTRAGAVAPDDQDERGAVR